MVECNGRRLAHIYTARGDPIRRVILADLGATPATVSEIARPFSVSPNAISKHLKMSEPADLVRHTVIGRGHRSGLRAQRLGEVAAWLTQYRVS